MPRWKALLVWQDTKEFYDQHDVVNWRPYPITRNEILSMYYPNGRPKVRKPMEILPRSLSSESLKYLKDEFERLNPERITMNQSSIGRRI